MAAESDNTIDHPPQLSSGLAVFFLERSFAYVDEAIIAPRKAIDVWLTSWPAIIAVHVTLGCSLHIMNGMRSPFMQFLCRTRLCWLKSLFCAITREQAYFDDRWRWIRRSHTSPGPTHTLLWNSSSMTVAWNSKSSCVVDRIGAMSMHKLQAVRQILIESAKVIGSLQLCTKRWIHDSGTLLREGMHTFLDVFDQNSDLIW